MSSLTVELNRFFRPFFYTPKPGEQATPENIRKQYNQLKSANKAPTLSQLSPGTSLGIGKFILGGILWLTGLAKDNSVLKWLGGLLTIGGAVLAGIGRFVYGVDLKSDDTPNGTGGPKPPDQKQNGGGAQAKGIPTNSNSGNESSGDTDDIHHEAGKSNNAGSLHIVELTQKQFPEQISKSQVLMLTQELEKIDVSYGHFELYIKECFNSLINASEDKNKLLLTLSEILEKDQVLEHIVKYPKFKTPILKY